MKMLKDLSSKIIMGGLVMNQTFSVGEAISFGGQALSRHLGAWVLITFLFTVIMLAINFIFGLVAPPGFFMGDGNGAIAWLILVNLIMLAVGGIFHMGYVRTTIKEAYGQMPEVMDLFSCIPLIGRYVLAYIFYTIIGVVSCAPGFIAIYLEIYLLIPVLLVPAIILLIRLWFFEYFIVDQEAGAIASLQLSWNATAGNALKLLGLFLLTGIIIAAGLIACFVGILFTAPLGLLSIAYAYKELSEPRGDFSQELF